MNCPICGQDNACGNLSDRPHETCWCTDEIFPREIFALVPPEQLNKSCICRDCLEKFKGKR
ncbi:MAG: cysteine-rich CWC family protein [Thermoactinomyces sp.]